MRNIFLFKDYKFNIFKELETIDCDGSLYLAPKVLKKSVCYLM